MPDQTTTLKISGMSCDHCRKRVEDALQKVRGVQSVKVDLASATAAVVGSAKEEKLIAAVREAGYEVVK